MAKNRRGSGAYSAKADARFCDQNTRKMFEAVVITLEGAPMADKNNDPAAVWQNIIGEMEK
jgi:hypothetical protein